MNRRKQFGFIGGGISQHTHDSGASGGNILQHVPPGTLIEYCGTVLPTGFLACDGAAVSRTTFANLFAAIGVTWGAGDGSTTFNVPDLRRRTTVGNGGAGTGQLGNAVGNTGGAETITLTAGTTPVLGTTDPGNHTHGQQANTALTTGGAIGDAVGGGNYTTGGTTGGAGAHTHTVNSGGGAAHNNYAPAAVVQMIVKT